MSASVNLDFFAAEFDQRAVLDFLFKATDVRVFESYSEFDADLREFRSIEEVASAFPLARMRAETVGLSSFSCGRRPSCKT